MATNNNKKVIRFYENELDTVIGSLPLTDQILVPAAEGFSTGWFAG
jgi:hypothetical protein